MEMLFTISDFFLDFVPPVAAAGLCHAFFDRLCTRQEKCRLSRSSHGTRRGPINPSLPRRSRDANIPTLVVVEEDFFLFLIFLNSKTFCEEAIQQMRSSPSLFSSSLLLLLLLPDLSAAFRIFKVWLFFCCWVGVNSRIPILGSVVLDFFFNFFPPL